MAEAEQRHEANLNAGEMMMEVVSPERRLFQEVVEAVMLPGKEGYLGVLPRHAPMVVALDTGIVTYRQQGETKKLAVSGGFCEVKKDAVIVLADAAEKADEIDVLRAQQAKQRAERRLKAKRDDIDEARAQAALRRALVRLEVAETGQGD